MAKKSDKKESKKDKKKAAPAKKKIVAKAAKKAAPKKAAKPVAKKAAAKKPAPKAKTAAAPKKAAATAKPVKSTKPTAKSAKQAAPAVKPVERGGKKAKEAEARHAKQTEVEPQAPEAAEEEVSEEIVLTDAEGRRYCRVKDCDQLAAVDGYCRYHYLLYWKRIQIRKKILSEGKLERYVEELTARYPDKFLEMLRKDLRSEKEFLAAIQELEIDESAVDNELEDETQTYIDEVRGMGEAVGTREEEDF